MSRNWGYEKRVFSASLSLILTRKSCSGSGTGSDFKRTALTKVKMPVLAPIPSAKVSTATNVKPGLLRICRNA